jgi:hypothetical protein
VYPTVHKILAFLTVVKNGGLSILAAGGILIQKLRRHFIVRQRLPIGVQYTLVV